MFTFCLVDQDVVGEGPVLNSFYVCVYLFMKGVERREERDLMGYFCKIFNININQIYLYYVFGIIFYSII